MRRKKWNKAVCGGRSGTRLYAEGEMGRGCMWRDGKARRINIRSCWVGYRYSRDGMGRHETGYGSSVLNGLKENVHLPNM